MTNRTEGGPTPKGKADKYRATPQVPLHDRRWPTRTLTVAPRWCSVDLRDGNQALAEPMGVERKRRLFECLLTIGLREIEVGFPSAARSEFDFVRLLIEQGLVPQDVTLQVITQAREHLIRRTLDSVRGAPRAVVNVYNSTSELQRRVVFGLPRDGVKALAVEAIRMLKHHSDALRRQHGTEIILQYAPESFSSTEVEFALSVCEAVMDVWEPTAQNPIILNLPATVEVCTPNVYADQVEFICTHLRHRDCAIVSVHPHNDRGTAVAAAELAQLAGAERVEGTLFGNGERAGNVDLITLALNLLTQGVEPGLKIDSIDSLVEAVEACTHLPVHPRHPYAGKLVFTTFAGSHQDAISKAMRARATAAASADPTASDANWEVPYLPLDPADIGRQNEPIVRLTSQSGRGGVAYVLERDHGFTLPRAHAEDLQERVQEMTESTGAELTSPELYEIFCSDMLRPSGPISLEEASVRVSESAPAGVVAQARVVVQGVAVSVEGSGPRVQDAFAYALQTLLGVSVRVVSLAEHGRQDGGVAGAAAYAEVILDDSVEGRGAGNAATPAVAGAAAVVNATCRALSDARLAEALSALATRTSGALDVAHEFRASIERS